MFDINSAFCSVELFTACQSSTDRKGGQAVPSLCNQCWGVCGGPTAIPDYSQNVRTSHCCGLIQVEEEQRCPKITVLKMNLSLASVNLERLHSSSENKVSQRATGCVYMMTVRTEDADVAWRLQTVTQMCVWSSIGRARQAVRWCCDTKPCGSLLTNWGIQFVRAVSRSDAWK